jgi:hypothetical protein
MQEETDRDGETVGMRASVQCRENRGGGGGGGCGVAEDGDRRSGREEIEGEKGTERRGDERGTDSWLHHISLAVVECALTVRAAPVVVQYQ